LQGKSGIARLMSLLTDVDPFLRHAAIQRLGLSDGVAAIGGSKNPAQRVGLLLAWRASNHAGKVDHIRTFLADADPEVRFMAAKWIADENLKEYRPQLVEGLKDRDLNVQ